MVVGVRYFTTWWSWCSCHCPTTKVTIVTVELEAVAKKKVLNAFRTMKSSFQLQNYIPCMFIHMHWDFFASLNIYIYVFFFPCFASMSASFMKLSQGIPYVVLKQNDPMKMASNGRRDFFCTFPSPNPGELNHWNLFVAHGPKKAPLEVHPMFLVILSLSLSLPFSSTKQNGAEPFHAPRDASGFFYWNHRYTPWN